MNFTKLDNIEAEKLIGALFRKVKNKLPFDAGDLSVALLCGSIGFMIDMTNKELIYKKDEATTLIKTFNEERLNTTVPGFTTFLNAAIDYTINNCLIRNIEEEIRLLNNNENPYLTKEYETKIEILLNQNNQYKNDNNQLKLIIQELKENTKEIYPEIINEDMFYQNQKIIEKTRININSNPTEIIQRLFDHIDAASGTTITYKNNLEKLMKKYEKLSKKTEEYGMLLAQLPNHPKYKEYEEKTINDLLKHYQTVSEQMITEYNKLNSGNITRLNRLRTQLKEDVDLLNYKKQRNEFLSETFEEGLTLDTYYNNTTIKKLQNIITEGKTERKNLFNVVKKMYIKADTIRDKIKEKKHIFKEKIKKMMIPDTYIKFLKYVKNREYNSKKYGKVIEKHYNCDNCKININQEMFAGYKIGPYIINLLQKKKLDRIIYFDIKNCCNEVEKLVLKALSEISKHHGGKSSIWYRNYLADKYYKYNKKNINLKFYHTFMAEKITDKNISIDEFLEESEKKFVYNKYYRKLDVEANLKVSICSLNKKDIKNKQYCDNKKIKFLFKKFTNLIYYDDVPIKREKKDIKEHISTYNQYKKAPNHKLKKSSIEKQLIKNGFISKDKIIDLISTKMERGEYKPFVTKVEGKLDEYEEILDKLIMEVDQIPNTTSLTKQSVKEIFPKYLISLND